MSLLSDKFFYSYEVNINSKWEKFSVVPQLLAVSDMSVILVVSLSFVSV